MASLKAGQRPGEGWWAYLVPYIAFLLVVEIARNLPDNGGFMSLILKPAVPALLLLYFFLRGEYPELRTGRVQLGLTLADIAVGVASAVLWVVPYMLLPDLRPEPSEVFNPMMAGPELIGWVLALRLLGFAFVTPVFEELFIRSFVMRYADALGDRKDFRGIPIGHFSPVSFLATVVVFTITHVPWEYWVAVPWIMLTNLYFYWRRSIGGLIVVHGAANAAIFSLVVFGGTWLQDSGEASSIWFFL